MQKVKPPYPLNKFPKSFAYKIGAEIVYSIATRERLRVQGEEWERIFANAIGADWKPSNVGLDDVVKGLCAWGAKSVKNTNPFTAKKVRLISGRNSPAYSYGIKDLSSKANKLGRAVLGIWNARVEDVRAKFSHLRTVVLVRSNDHVKFMVFEKETILYRPEKYIWKMNKRENLEGYEKRTDFHKFTWQPHGSQFTIIEPIPEAKLRFTLKHPNRLSQKAVLKSINFDKSWVQVIKE